MKQRLEASTESNDWKQLHEDKVNEKVTRALITPASLIVQQRFKSLERQEKKNHKPEIVIFVM